MHLLSVTRNADQSQCPVASLSKHIRTKKQPCVLGVKHTYIPQSHLKVVVQLQLHFWQAPRKLPDNPVC